MTKLHSYGLVTVTEICNNDCSFCDLGRSNRGARHRDPDDIRVQLQKMRDADILDVAFTGGEATLHSDLPAVVAHASSLGFRTIRLYSHGRSFAKTNLLSELVESGLNQMMISLFGPTPESHDAASLIDGSFAQTLEGIGAAARSSVHLVVNAPVTRENVGILGKYLDVLDEHASPETIWQLSDLYPTSKVLRDPSIHAEYGVIAAELRKVLTEATIRGRKFLLQEFPLCVLFPWHTDAKELGPWARIMFHIADDHRPQDLWRAPPWVSPDRFYADECSSCSLKHACLGITHSYQRAHSDLGFVNPF